MNVRYYLIPLTPAALAVLALSNQHSPISEFRNGITWGILSSEIFLARFRETRLMHSNGSITLTDSCTTYNC